MARSLQISVLSLMLMSCTVASAMECDASAGRCDSAEEDSSSLIQHAKVNRHDTLKKSSSAQAQPAGGSCPDGKPPACTNPPTGMAAMCPMFQMCDAMPGQVGCCKQMGPAQSSVCPNGQPKKCTNPPTGMDSFCPFGQFCDAMLPGTPGCCGAAPNPLSR
eukprot:TRINITY_DN1448_c0_g1_i1.p1 TRINITY_DN1448_c0_g1~~TRINITY_DN1448_c0_g1_i1.p1  ORF type:complete len:183 (-),score=30.20 TRINITY_DN1448_c0_g1_i1:161-643(-)